MSKLEFMVLRHYRSGEKVTAKAHGGKIDFQGITVIKLTDDFRIRALEIWFDPLEMFRQIAGNSGVNKEAVGRLGKYQLLPGEGPMTHLKGMDDHINMEKEASSSTSREEVPTRSQSSNDHARPTSPMDRTGTNHTATFVMSRMTVADCPFLSSQAQAGESSGPWGSISVETMCETVTYETTESISP